MHGSRVLIVSFLLALVGTGCLLTGCGSGGNGENPTPIDYRVEISEPTWVVPSENLPPEVTPGVSNNNVGIAFHEDRLYLAWRTAETHFASPNARMYVVSSPDMGETWEFETQVALGTDVREPFLLSVSDRLVFTFFEAGSNPLAFEPKHMWRTMRGADGRWGALEQWGRAGEVPWELKVRGGRAWMTSYKGNHYGAGPSDVDVYFQTSDDGLDWEPVDPGAPAVYVGGVSEVGFEFDEQGDLWAVTRNEDGDASGFGSHLVTAPAASLGRWQFPEHSNPERYDSPRMFRHGEDLYLVARRDVGGPYDLGLDWLPFDIRKPLYLAAYSLSPKRTWLYEIDRVSRSVVPVVELPSAGDNAFPSIVQTGDDTYLVANYTSPVQHGDWSWLAGQVSREGTQIYFVTIRFVPVW